MYFKSISYYLNKQIQNKLNTHQLHLQIFSITATGLCYADKILTLMLHAHRLFRLIMSMGVDYS